MKQIRASEIQPGMTIEWSELGIKYTCVVSSIEPACSQISQEIMASGGGEATLYNNTMVTVLAEAQPEEPTEFGEKVVVAGERALCIAQGLWLTDGLERCTWDDLCEMGPVTVIPDQGWTVPTETPEVPERIDEWPEDDEALRPYPWRDRDGGVWKWLTTASEWECYDEEGYYLQSGGRPFYGPWTRETDA